MERIYNTEISSKRSLSIEASVIEVIYNRGLYNLHDVAFSPWLR